MSRNPDEISRYSPHDLIALVPRLSWRRMLVIGDVFLDEYIEGQAARLSREAPVPVLEFERRILRPGGAANPAHNIVALRGHAVQVGVVGDDEAGRQLSAELRCAGIDPAGLIVDAQRPTSTKTRIISRSSLRFPQQLARIDRLDRRPISGEIERGVQESIRTHIPGSEAVLVSDYRTGVVTDAVIATVLAESQGYGRLLCVDSQGNLSRYKGFQLVKCNQAEAENTLGRPLVTLQQVRSACEDLLEGLRAETVVITRGANGIAGLSRREGFAILPAANRSEVYDVVGAGDTVIAVLAMALAARFPFEMALRLSNFAAGLVVRKLGNATTTQDELCWAIEHW